MCRPLQQTKTIPISLASGAAVALSRPCGHEAISPAMPNGYDGASNIRPSLY